MSCVRKSKQRAQYRLSAREHFYIDQFKGYKAKLDTVDGE